MPPPASSSPSGSASAASTRLNDGERHEQRVQAACQPPRIGPDTAARAAARPAACSTRISCAISGVRPGAQRMAEDASHERRHQRSARDTAAGRASWIARQPPAAATEQRQGEPGADELPRASPGNSMTAASSASAAIVSVPSAVACDGRSGPRRDRRIDRDGSWRRSVADVQQPIRWHRRHASIGYPRCRLQACACCRSRGQGIHNCAIRAANVA